MARKTGAASIVAAIAAVLMLAACVSDDPGKVYDYSKAGFTPDHSR